MWQPINVSLSPNVFFKDVLKAVRILFSPSSWVKGPEIRQLEVDFARLFPDFQSISFVSGRTSLLAILKAFGLTKDAEVLCQSFSCVVVPSAIIASGAKPIFVDIEKDSFNMDPTDLSGKITSKSQAVIIQHTFGYPARMESLLAIAKKNNLLVIEDCAHGIGIAYKGRQLGTFGEAAFFSFGRDKPISSVFGGMAITKDKRLTKKIRAFQKSLAYPPEIWVVQQLFHPLFFALILPVYNFLSFGKMILVVSQFLKLLSLPVTRREKRGGFPPKMRARLPNGLASLARFQLRRLKGFNQTRREISQFYRSSLGGLPIILPSFQIGKKSWPLLRFTIKTERAWALYQFAKKRGVLLNNWYCPAISPRGVKFSKIGYKPESCPVAEAEARRVVNLPTHPKMKLKDAQKVVRIIRAFFSPQSKKGLVKTFLRSFE